MTSMDRTDPSEPPRLGATVSPAELSERADDLRVGEVGWHVVRARVLVTTEPPGPGPTWTDVCAWVYSGRPA